MKAADGGSSGGRRRRKVKGVLDLTLSLLLLLPLITLSFHVSSAISTSSNGDNDDEHSKGGAFKYKIIRRASTFPKQPSSVSSPDHGQHNIYDYIIVGGGTAGCPLAATLSEKYRVLVLERGGVPFNNINVSYMQNFHINLGDLSATSASQFFVSTDGVLNARARVLGGGSCINAGFYSRASSSFIKRVGWEPGLANESYKWVEKQIIRFPTLAPWQRAVRDGLLEVGVSPYNGFTYDHKYGTKVGGTIFEEDGQRRTAAELLASGNPNNLLVLVHAIVQKIMFDTTSGRNPKAIGVLFKDEMGAMHEVYLSDTQDRQSEIIVSSGSIGSPQMLLLSGIGPKADLEKFNISVVIDNKFVGKDIADNPLNTIFVPMKSDVNQSLIQTVGITKQGVYIETSSGFGSSSDTIIRNNQLSTISQTQRATIKAIKAFKERKKALPVEAFKGGFIIEKVAAPKSRGELHLTNTNPDENPSITFNYFSHPDDLKRCVEGIKIIEKVVKSKSFSNFTGNELTFEKILNMSSLVSMNLVPRHTKYYDTTNLMQFCKDTVITIWHYHGGCHVGKVIDQDYRVLGVHRLRIIDGSTFHESPGTNPQATVMMIGRYMGLKILGERKSG